MSEDTLFGTPEQAIASMSTPAPAAEPVQANEQTEEPQEPTGTSLDTPVASADAEALRKQLLGDYTRKTQEIAPFRRLLTEQGVTLEDVQAALQLNRAVRENPEMFAQILQNAINASQSSQGQQQVQTQSAQAQQPATDPLATLAETYGEEVAGPIRQVYEVAQKAHQTAAQLQEQLQKERELREKETLQNAVLKAENDMAAWLGKNQHFGLKPEQIRAEIARTFGKQGIMAGLTAKDFDAAALRILGPDKYQEAVYAQRLKAERDKVEKTTPGPVVAPGAATATAPADGPGFDSPGSMLDGAVEYVEALRRSMGG